MKNEAFEFRVRVGAWRDIEPQQPWSRGPDREIDVTVTEGRESYTLRLRIEGDAVERVGAEYVEQMRHVAIREAIADFMKERELNEQAERLGREMASAQFDHRPNDLMPEDFYSR